MISKVNRFQKVTNLTEHILGYFTLDKATQVRGLKIIQPKAGTYSEGFVTEFPHAVGLYYSYHAAQTSKWELQKTYYNKLLTQIVCTCGLALVAAGV